MKLLGVLAILVLGSPTLATKYARQASSSGTTSYGDCRDSSCPGGSCVSSDPSNSNAGYVCQFPSASSTPASAASSTGSSSGFSDCRGSANGCPGGSCVPGDPSNPNSGYICSFSSAAGSSASRATTSATQGAASTTTDMAPTTLIPAAVSTSAQSVSAASASASAASGAAVSGGSAIISASPSTTSRAAGVLGMKADTVLAAVLVAGGVLMF